MRSGASASRRRDGAQHIFGPPPAIALRSSPSSSASLAAIASANRLTEGRRTRVEVLRRAVMIGIPTSWRRGLVRISVVPPRCREFACRDIGVRPRIRPCSPSRRTIARLDWPTHSRPRRRCSWRNRLPGSARARPVHRRAAVRRRGGVHPRYVDSAGHLGEGVLYRLARDQRPAECLAITAPLHSQFRQRCALEYACAARPIRSETKADAIWAKPEFSAPTKLAGTRTSV